jgi:hypothetical protein
MEHTRQNSSKKTKKQVESHEPVRSSRTRKPVKCNCNKCNGKEVDPRTRRRHVGLTEKFKGHTSGLSPPAKKREVEQTQVEEDSQKMMIKGKIRGNSN